MARSEKLVKNSIIVTISFFVMQILSLYTQRVFVKQLGYEIQGLNATFLAIISALSITELGIGTAIVFSLYKPIAENNEEKIAILILLYRKIYIIIGGIILVLGISVIGLLPALTNNEFTLAYLFPPFLIFLFNSALGYLFSFNHTLLAADQKQYVISFVSSAVKILTAGLQIFSLYYFQSYIVYILISSVIGLAGNIALTLYVKKIYPYLKKHKGKLASEEKAVLKRNVLALVYHRIGNYLVTGTGGLVVSSFVAVSVAAYYANYFSLANTLIMLIGSIFAGVLAAFGNVLATESKDQVRSLFERYRFLNFFVFAIATTGIFVLINDVLTVWLNAETVLGFSFLLFFSINFYITGYSQALGNVRAAAGAFSPDRYIHILIAGINIALSLIMVRFWGVTGVLVGTTISLFIKEICVLPHIGTKYVYGGKTRNYYFRMIFDTVVLLSIISLTYFVYGLVPFSRLLFKLIYGVIICVAIPSVLLVAIYFKTHEFNYLVEFAKKMLARITAPLKNRGKKANEATNAGEALEKDEARSAEIGSQEEISADSAEIGSQEEISADSAENDEQEEIKSQ